MQHDVYSLGVCLLELGLWESFVRYEGSIGDDKVPGVRLGLSLGDFEFEPGQLARNLVIKEQLVNLARGELRLRMGDRFSSVVLTCLNCLDADNDDFGGEDTEDEDGVLVGVKFIEKVLLRLGEIMI